MTNPPPPNGRSLELDALRGVAVLLVLLHHLPPLSPGGFLARLLRPFQLGGWVGVDLFFVLSGFLVSGLLMREYRRHGEIHVGRFLIRRGFKIYPAFYLLIGLTAWVEGLGGDGRSKAFLAEIFFVQNYFHSLWAHTWTLAVEEHFYLLIALVLYGLTRGGKGEKNPFADLPRAGLLIAIAVLVGRVLNAALFEFHPKLHINQTLSRIDALTFGTVLAYAYHFRHSELMAFCRKHSRLLFTLGTLLLAPPFFFKLSETPFIYTLGMSLHYLGGGMILGALLAGESKRRLSTGLLARIGVYSYSIYLWHLPILNWGVLPISADGNLSENTVAAIYLIATIGLGMAMARLIEFPALWLRDRLFPSRSPHSTSS